MPMQRYLDYNATAPMAEPAIEAYVEAARSLPGNASSLHWAGREARRRLEDAREQIAEWLHVEPGSIVFTSGGTEADNIAVQGVLSAAEPGRVVSTAIEHPAVLRPLARWQTAAQQARGWQVELVRPDRQGVVQAKAMIERIDGETRLVCMMLANNETGAVQPVAEVAAHCRARGVPLLVDAVQALGKLPLDLGALDADFVALSAHKIGGPRGVGALVVRRGQRLRELAPGGGQERKRRSGTENVPGIVAFAAALAHADFARTAELRDVFERELLQAIPDAEVFAQAAPRVPNTSMFAVPGMDGETLLMQLDLAGFAVASGSACSSGKRDPSHVLLAMGVDRERARAAIRVSFGPHNSLDDGRALVAALVAARARLRRMAGLAA